MKTITIDPRKITIDDSKNGRWDVVSPDAVIRLADDMMRNGQLQPVEVIEKPDGSFHAVFGFTRIKAGVAIVEGFKRNDKKISKPGFLLTCNVVETKDDKETLLRNIRENMLRTDLTPMDHACNITTLLDMGMKYDAIGKLYGKDKGWVSRYNSLNKLPDATKELLHKGAIGVNTAVLMLEKDNLDTAEMETLTAKYGADLTADIVKGYIRARDTVQPDTAPPTPPVANPTVPTTRATVPPVPPPAGKNYPRSLTEIKNLITKYTADDTQPVVRTLFAGLLAYAGGSILDTEFEKIYLKCEKLLDAE